MGYAHSVVDYLFRWLGENFPGPGAIDPAAAVTGRRDLRGVRRACHLESRLALPGLRRYRVWNRPLRVSTRGAPLGTVTGTKNEQGAPSVPDGWALEWLPAERLEDGLEAREILARGHPAGLTVHKYGPLRKRNVLLGPIGQALGAPPGWLDGLDPDEAIETILQATALRPPEDLEKALSAWNGVKGG